MELGSCGAGNSTCAAGRSRSVSSLALATGACAPAGAYSDSLSCNPQPTTANTSSSMHSAHKGNPDKLRVV